MTHPFVVAHVILFQHSSSDIRGDVLVGLDNNTSSSDYSSTYLK